MKTSKPQAELLRLGAPELAERLSLVVKAENIRCDPGPYRNAVWQCVPSGYLT